MNREAIDGRVHYVGGRKGLGLGTSMTTVHEVYDPATQTWTTAAPLARARSGMNAVVARGCFHVWGGEGPAGVTRGPRDDVDDAVDGVGAPEHRAGAADDFDALDILEHVVEGIPEDP